MHHPTYRIALTTAFVTPVVEHWLEREIALQLGPKARLTIHLDIVIIITIIRIQRGKLDNLCPIILHI